MAFKMGMSREDLSGPPPVPAGIYTLEVAGFRPKLSKQGDSLNFNAEFTIEHPEYDGRKIFHPLNTKFAVAIRDFVHATGIDMEKNIVKNDEGEDVEEFNLPGTFKDADKYPDDPTKWGAYMGPLLKKKFKAEVVETEYNGKKKNEIRCFFCELSNCATMYPDMKHSQNLIKS